jgi:hypothetical protein
MFTRVRYYNPVQRQFNPAHTFTSSFLNDILILFSHLNLRLPRGLFLSGSHKACIRECVGTPHAYVPLVTSSLISSAECCLLALHSTRLPVLHCPSPPLTSFLSIPNIPIIWSRMSHGICVLVFRRDIDIVRGTENVFLNAVAIWPRRCATYVTLGKGI